MQKTARPMELLVHVFFAWCRTRSPQDDEVICAESFDDRMAMGEEYEEAKRAISGQWIDRVCYVGKQR